jgi:malate dehydrogenase
MLQTEQLGSGIVSRKRITVVGAGNLGASCAQRLAERDYADIVMVDLVAGLARGKALDLSEAGPVAGYEPNLIGTDGYETTSGSNVCVITSGLPRSPGMSRDELLSRNREIVASVTAQLARRSPDAILIVVTNPLDAMCHVALEVSKFPRSRVVGMAGILDAARFRTFIAWELGVSARDVTGLVLGGHGDTMVPVVSSSTAAGVPIGQRIDSGRLEQIVQRTREGGAEVVGLLGDGSACYGPSAGVAEMVDSIVLDQKRVLPCAALCQGEFGIDRTFVGVPCRLGAAGIEEIVELELSAAERRQLHASAESVRQLVEAMARPPR